MAIDRSGQLQQELAEYLARQTTNNAGVDTNEVINIVNDYLPQGEQVQSTSETATLGVYKRLNATDIVTGKVQVTSTGLWGDGTGSLSSFFTSSTQDTGASGKYYLDVYDKATSDATATVQFSVTYGHRTGFGAATISDDSDATLPTKAIYAQYRNILLTPDDTQFTFISSSEAGTHDSDGIYVINVQRAQYREQLDPGNIALTLSGSLGTVTLIDDSGKKLDNTVGKSGRVFNMVTGSLNLGGDAAIISSSYASNGQGYGLIYPDLGIIVLNPTALGADVDQNLTGSAAVDGTDAQEYPRNHRQLFTNMVLGQNFEARRTENISTSHYFVRANNREFNFSNNPTFVTGSDGSFKQSTFELDPKVYITTVGLYNDANELLAVAKLSQPTQKSFDSEVLIKVKLSF